MLFQAIKFVVIVIAVLGDRYKHPPNIWSLRTNFRAGKVKVKSLSYVRLFVTPQTVAYQASPSIHGIFPGKSTGMACHFLLQGDLPDLGIEPWSPTL